MKNRSNRLPTISDTPDDWVDESWVVDCVCGVNFDDGEEMVDCDECGVWVHTRCARYVKSEKLFACDKCKGKKLRKENEETEVAQLLVELPTKTMRMENSYSVSCSVQNPFQVWTEVPMEDKVHVQGIPGGDPTLFSGVSSIFGPELWKCTGYVPKKFKYQYREFPCWEDRHDDDDDDDDGGKKIIEDIEKRTSNGADALFSLSKENGRLKSEVNGGGGLDMGPPTTDRKKQEVENHENRRQQSGLRKERSLLKPVVVHSGKQKKYDLKVFKDQNRKRSVKVMEKDRDSKKINHYSSDSVPTKSSDAKQSEPNDGKGLKVFKIDKNSSKRDNSRVVVQTNHKSDHLLDNSNPASIGQPSEDVNDARINPSREAKQMEENDVNQVSPSGQISPKKEDGKAASPLIKNSMQTNTVEHEDGLSVDDVNPSGRSSSRSDETGSNKSNVEKASSAPNGEIHAPIEVKAVEINRAGNTSNIQSDIKQDSSKTLAEDMKIPDDPPSTSSAVKKEDVYMSQKVQNVDKSIPHDNSKADEPDESPGRLSQPKEPMKGPESSTEAHGSSKGQAKSHGTVTSPSGAPNKHNMTVSTVTKSSAGKPSSKPSVPDKARYYSTEDRKLSVKQKGVSDNNTKSKKDIIGDASEKPKKVIRDLPKSPSTSALKSSHLSRSSSAPVSKKNSSDLKDPAFLSSSKTSSVTPDSGDSANSLRSESGTHEQNKSTSEKTSQLSRQPAPKNHLPHVHPMPSTNSPATLSDEELALLLHQELNSSPRVPRVPRMRHAGGLPQLATGTSTSTLMKRTSTSGLKDNGLASRKKNKDLTNNGASNSRESDGPKKVDRMHKVPYSRRHDPVKNGSAKVVPHVDKSAPTASTTVSSGPSSSNEAARSSPQNASDDEPGAVGAPTHRTLPALIAEIMSKGKRMTYEELCNAVLPHWSNLRKHNGERYAYSSHSQAVLDCLRNRSEWSRLVDRGPKTNAGRKRRKSETDTPNLESEEDDYSTDRNTKDNDSSELSKGKQRARKLRRLAQRRGNKDTRTRRRRKAEVVSSDDDDSSSDSSEESEYSDEEMQEGKTSGQNEASGSSDEMETTS
uniref:protein phosphatase 1 regulatory subunit 12A n=1 Tax=Erigeron canadensis TaxID=72917 RepID=UPI001CB8FF4C|nr:protein phosphatase 1 regulatory subunit 12A [Erigeron canadensis]